jgi:hypothetical protein
MTRAWRIEYEGALYHVLSRGNDKQDNQATGADGVKIAVLRKGRPGLKFIWAAAHARRYLITKIFT